MSKMVGLGLDSNGEGRIEFHKDYTDRLDNLFGGLGLNLSAPEYRAYGRSATAVSVVSVFAKSDPDVLDRVREALLNAGFEVGLM